MKSNAKWFLGTFVVGLIALYAFNAHAEGEVICIIQVSTAGATSTGPQSNTAVADGGTTYALPDAGTPCGWAAGSVIAMQCDDAVVCYDPSASTGGVATVGADLCVNMQTGSLPSDPPLIGLNTNQQKISMIAKSVGDGGSLTQCKMALTKRVTGK